MRVHIAPEGVCRKNCGVPVVSILDGKDVNVSMDTRLQTRERNSRDQLFLTDEGRRALTAELDELLTVRRPQIASVLAEAWQENTEREEDTLATQIRDEMGQVEQRIQELERILQRAVPPPPTAVDGRVSLGSRVRVRYDDGDESIYTLVTAVEAQASQGRISAQAPVGRALLGKRPGEDVLVHTPVGEQMLTILALL